MANSQGAGPEPIAIVGLACRFPGGAESPELLWDLLRQGKNAWAEFPSDRMNINGFYHPSPERDDSFNFKGAHFITSNVAAFDAKFFGVASKEADAIDPQQRMLLEVAYEALENAGMPMEDFVGSKTCVFIGSFVKDYEQISMRDQQTTAPDCATGNSIAIMSNRISYCFDFSGTSQTIETGCSASLVSLHQAVNNLRNGQSDMALAGGAGLILTPSTIMPMTSLGFLSEDGKCWTFDHRANGYGRGEGVGIVVLKRLSDALRDNDTIRAVIRGTASNQDGHTPGITVPNPDAQVRCIKEAYANAQLSTDGTSYVECHGTGTKVGDWRELKAISTALSSTRPIDKPMMVGSIKPNVGHLEGSAGVAGLIRAILILEKGKIPPHINFEKWNPDILHEEWRVDIARKMHELTSKIRRASVNCFGFGGTNAHAVLEDGGSFLTEKSLIGHHNSFGPSAITAKQGDHDNSSPRLFVFSAQHREGLQEAVSAYTRYLQNASEGDVHQILNDLSYTLYNRRSLLDYRASFIANGTEDLQRVLAGFDSSQVARATSKKPLNIALVFCGQGAQWARMGLGLLNIPAFYKSIIEAAEYMAGLSVLTAGQPPFDLLAHLKAEGATSQINVPEVSQPATTAIQVALVDLLKAIGIKPVAVVGHSSGEIAAAYAAGHIERRKAWELAFLRGSAAANLSKIDAKIQGAMVAVGIDYEKAARLLVVLEAAGTIKPGSVRVACINSPRLVTLSGDRDGVLAVKAQLEQDKTFHRLLKVETAYHSHHMEFAAPMYLKSISRTPFIRPYIATIPMYSSVTGEAISADKTRCPEYWVENMVGRVEFVEAIKAMTKDQAAKGTKPNFFIEVSPHGTLATSVRDIFEETGTRQESFGYISALSNKLDDQEASLAVVAEIWKLGHRVELDTFLNQGTDARPKCLVDLPRYAWDHSKTYWHESHLSRQHRFREFGSRDLIGAPTADAVLPFEPRWRGHLRLQENPWMADHKVQGEMLYPASGMITMALEAAKQVVWDHIDNLSDILDYEVGKFHIKAPMVIPSHEAGLEHCMNAKRVSESIKLGVTTWKYEFAIFSKPGRDPPFIENASGVLTVRFRARGSTKNSRYTPKVTMSTIDPAKSEVTPFEFYEGLDVIGMQYGPLFRNIKYIDAIRDEGDKKACTTAMTIPNTKESMPHKFEFDHVMHPATLDTMFQSIFTLGTEPMVPYYIKSIRIQAGMPVAAGTNLLMNTHAGRTGLREVTADVLVSGHSFPSSDGPNVCNKLVEINGLRAMAVATSAAGNLRFLPNHRHLCSEIQWKPDVAYAGFSDLAAWLEILGHKNPGLTVLHVGRSIDLVKAVFDTLAPGGNPDQGRPAPMNLLGKYTIRGMDDDGADKLEETFTAVQRLLVNLESSGDAEAADSSETFDLVIAETGSTHDVSHLAENVNSSGFLLVCQSTPTGEQKLEIKGLREVGSYPSSETTRLHLFTKPVPPRVTTLDVAILLPSPDLKDSALVTELREILENQGLDTSVVDRDWLSTIGSKDSNLSVISLLDLDTYSVEDQVNSKHHGLVFEMESVVYYQIKKLLETPKNLLWISQDAQMECANPKNALFQGWSRVVRSEDAQKNIITVDVVPNAATLQSLAPRLARIFMDSFFSTTAGGGSGETEFCLNGTDANIPRLIPLTGLNHVLEEGRGRAVFFETGSFANNPRGPLKLDIGVPGDLSSLVYRVDDEGFRPLRSGEVRLAVRATQILPVDLNTVMGKGTEQEVGLDVYGQVLEMHSSCARNAGLALGVDVVARVRGSVRSHVIVPAKMVHKVWEWKKSPSKTIESNDHVNSIGKAVANGHKHDHEVANGTANGHVPGLDIEQVPRASLTVSSFAPWSPSTLACIRMFIKAYRSQCHLSPSTDKLVEHVVVFGAEGAFGQALVQAMHVEKLFLNHITLVVDRVNPDIDDVTKTANGKTVYKTGGDRVPTREGRIVLDDEHLVDEVMELTNGRGADVIFDMTFSGHEAVTECIRDGGSIFGFKSAISTNQTTLRSDVTIWRADPFGGNDWRDDEKELQLSFQLMQDTQLGPFAEYPNFHTVSKFSDVADAFKYLAQSPNHGAHILEADSAQKVRVGFSPVKDSLTLKADTSYMIVGGFGGLGRDIALWLASKGAKHLIFVSRSGFGGPDSNASMLLDSLKAKGVETYSLKADICDKEGLKTALLRLEGYAPKIAGVIHAAGVLEDYTYRNMTHDAWNASARVKTVGSWNLHELLPADIDFLLFLSSAAGVIGNRGQANYAAGNAFQDALARHRHARGLHTVSMDLGPILGPGMVDQEMMDLLKGVGFFGIRRSDLHLVLERAVIGRGVLNDPFPPQVVLGVGTGGLIRQNKPADPFWAHTALFAHLNRLDLDASATAGDDAGGDGGLGLLDLQPKLKLATTMNDAVNVILAPLVAAMVSVIPNLSAADVRPDMTPTECQSDSMRGTYIDNWLRRTTGVSIGQGINGMPIRAICEEVVRRGGFAAGAESCGVLER